MLCRLILGLLLAAMVLALAACGGGSGATAVQVTLTDFKLESSASTFSTGTPYRFVIENRGATSHEWTVMPAGEKDHHKALTGVTADKLLVGAKVTQEFIFKQPGTYEFACHLAGHYEAGMSLRITVQ